MVDPRHVPVLAVALAIGALAARADELLLADGRVVEGDVTREGEFYVVKGARGASVRIPAHEVVSIKKTPSRLEVFREQRARLESSEDRTSALAWAELARAASDSGLLAEAKSAAEKALELDPDCEPARRLLGFVRHEGRWLPEDEAMAAKGMVRVGGRWVPKEEAEKAAQPGASDSSAAEERPKASFGRQELVTCPRCNGTGVAIWITCRQCSRSGKPGYLNMGDHLEVCTRCGGQGRLPGLACSYCAGTGRIDPSNPRTPTGRAIPKGFKVCPDCGGTGVNTWIPCNQCRRSPQPGVLDMGDHFEICNRCNGLGKLVGLWCATCQRSGMVRE